MTLHNFLEVFRMENEEKTKFIEELSDKAIKLAEKYGIKPFEAGELVRNMSKTIRKDLEEITKDIFVASPSKAGHRKSKL